MLSVFDYCCSVQNNLRRKLNTGGADGLKLFKDRGLASIAVTHASMGENTEALEIAEKLAEDTT